MTKFVIELGSISISISIRGVGRVPKVTWEEPQKEAD